MKIYAPVKDATGVWASVRFVNGVGETDNPALIDWFKDHGYTIEKSDNQFQKSVEKCEETPENSLEKCDEVEMMGYNVKQPDFESMTPLEIREWAKANGFGGQIKNTRNKEKLIEIIRG